MKNYIKIFTLTLLMGSLTTFLSCNDEELSNLTDIVTFSMANETGPAEIDLVAHTIDVEVALGTDLTSLIPTFTLSPGATAVPATGTAGDYTNEVTINVTAQDGVTKQAWKVTVTRVLNVETDILTFTIPTQTGDATINSIDHTLAIEAAIGTDATSIAPTFTLSDGATSDPASETAGDYTNPVSITVTAEDGTTTQDWTVTVTVAVAPSSATDILTFTMPGQTGASTINSDNHTVAIEVAEGTDVTDLTPTFTLSAGATSDPTSGTAGNYSNPVAITVTAQDGTATQDWTVAVSVAVGLSDATDILSFTLAEQTGDALIHSELHKLVIKVAAGTDLTSLTPTFTLSAGATSVPTSGTAGDYSSAVTIAITAEDGSTTQDWIAKVLVEGVDSDENDILTFTMPDETGPATIDVLEYTVDIEVANGTDLASLTPTFTVSEKATAAPASGTTGDYSSVVTIAVTAEDGSTQDWAVTVTEEGSSATDIETFSFAVQTGDATINNTAHTVDIEVEAGTDLTSLTPTFTLSAGANSAPASGTVGDYSSAFTITVTAEDGTTTQDWTVNVTKELNNETDILTYTMPSQTGDGTIDIASHTVDITVAGGTNLASLTPTFTLSDGATSVPASGTAGDYTSPVIIAVTAEDGTTTQDWTINVTMLSSETDILTFSVTDMVGDATIDAVNHTVTAVVANGTDLFNVVGTWTLSPGATSNPASGVTNVFLENLSIVVGAEDGTTLQVWNVAVYAAETSATDILHFMLAEQTLPATINRTTHEIDIQVASGTGLTNLSPTIILPTGATSVPSSGTPGDYTPVVTITVTAQDGTTKEDWRIFVTEVGGTPRSDETDILSFSFTGQESLAEINPSPGTIDIFGPLGADHSSLTPTFTLSDGATADPASGVAGNYDPLPTEITVTAEDGRTTRVWEVFIKDPTTPLSQLRDILTFSITGQVGDAELDKGQNRVRVTVASGTDVSNLTPTFTLSPGATSVPISGIAGDYSSDKTIIVTAANGTAQNWVVEVTIE